MNKPPLLLLSLILITAILLKPSFTLAQQPTTPETPDSQTTPTPTPSIETPQEPLIIGGSVAGLGEFPWQVALVDSTASNPYNGQFCGGSLVSPGWVLTAAHCITSNGVIVNPSTIDVVLGINLLSSGPTHGSQGQRIGINQIFRYPTYNSSTEDSDLALLKLEQPATLGARVNWIRIASTADSALFTPGVMATVTGWGNTSTIGITYPDALMKVNLPIVSNTTCNSSYNGAITSNMLCAGFAQGGRDSCQGDSGGPLIVSDGAGSWKLAGIVSWGSGCAQPDYYGVYTRLANFKVWIDAYILPPIGKVYLPLAQNNSGGTPSSNCTPSPSGDSDNITDALTICSGQHVTGQVDSFNDPDDVYKIMINSGQKLTITLTGNGNSVSDIDLYLYTPDTTDIYTQPAWRASANLGNDELISDIVNLSGFWYVDVSAYWETINYTLEAVITNP